MFWHAEYPKAAPAATPAAPPEVAPKYQYTKSLITFALLELGLSFIYIKYTIS